MGESLEAVALGSTRTLRPAAEVLAVLGGVLRSEVSADVVPETGIHAGAGVVV